MSQPQITLYRFKVSLIGDRYVPAEELHRIIDVSANAPFFALHEAIYEAFDRYDPHLCKFLLTRQEVKYIEDLFNATEEVGDMALVDDSDFEEDEDYTLHDWASYTIADAALKEQDCIYYWFDFGDDWIHRLQLEQIFQIDDDEPEREGYIAAVIEKVGKSPEQYGDDSIWMDEEMQESLGLMILMEMCDPAKNISMTWADLELEGVAEDLWERGFIEKPESDDEPVTITDEGREAAAAFSQMLEEVMKQGGW
ncbi:hypothetical protein L1281_000711 [Neisseria sp. HSC-16F19]|nr:plasmid pRiA4b ORF-3 family protein [Neisseria sp. HSC-16F19]MCP2040131.1 hypothetical protein [Neisseria sp. HSC-16F19]